MLIKFQDKTGIINLQNCTALQISPYTNSPKIKSSMFHEEVANQRMYIYADEICLGEYPTLKRAEEVLEAVCSAYEDSCFCIEGYDSAAQNYRPYLHMKNSVFEMPEE